MSSSLHQRPKHDMRGWPSIVCNTNLSRCIDTVVSTAYTYQVLVEGQFDAASQPVVLEEHPT